MNRYTKLKDLHASRLTGIGASDIATLAGLNKKWGQTPLTLWREKRGLTPPFEGNTRTDWGNRLEAMVLQKFIEGRYGEDTGDAFLAGAIRGRSTGPFKVKTEAIHPDRRYCLSHADMLYDPYSSQEVTNTDLLAEFGERYLVEAKTSGLYSAKRREGVAFEGWDPDDRTQFGIPDKVFMQVQWQMYTYGVNEAWVVVLIDTADYREYGPVIFDPRHLDKSLALAETFWTLVQTGAEPTPATWGDVVSLLPNLENKTAIATGEAEMQARTIIKEGREAKERIKALESKIEDGKMALGILAGDTELAKTMNRVLVDSDGNTLATFRDQTRDALSLSMADIKKKQAKAESNAKKLADGKTLKPADIEAATMTAEDLRIIAVEAELRALGCYKTSEASRIVTY